LAPLALAAAWTGWCGGITVWGSSLYQNEVRLFETISALHPESIVSRFVLGQCHVRQGAQEKTAPVAEKMLDLIFRGGQWEERTGLKRGLEQPEVRRRVLQNQGTRSAPEVFVGQALITLGYSLIARGEITRASKALSLAEALPGNEGLVDLAQGFLAMRENRLDLAVSRLESASRRLPNSPWPRQYLAEVYAALEEPELAAARRAEVEQLSARGYTLNSTW
jgi:hypothetical protein